MISEEEKEVRAKALKLLRDNLSPEDLARFDSFDPELQHALVMKAIDEGIITFEIRRRD